MAQSNSGYEKSDVKPLNLFIAAGIIITVLIVLIVAINEIFLSEKSKAKKG